MSVRVSVSQAALRANLSGSDQGSVLDLRADAWGHGLRVVAEAVRAETSATALVDPHAAASVIDAGFPADRIVTSAGPTVPGEQLYGLDGPGVPVMRLNGGVISSKELKAGEGVSYGYRYRATRDTRIALVSGGYADGVVRGLGGRIAVTIGDARCPVLGRVAMDVCVVEIGDADVRRGDVVWYFGDPAEGHPPVAEWAAHTGASAAEIVATVGRLAGRAPGVPRSDP
ncbi:alanine racemase C-terminal domain-containing protein [Microbacterium sp. Marseille-Q6648]|uniref:alanine racemase C-terminal domain-containing protein n=1 Tax=Microbacterium sp. Marseille-Q6648 TaxID=2937991 RepID=UPI002041211F|nr:alanine racemase C-terminal domain-containing protein [Microbacterium sp. Marseille-Q6648]